MPFTVTTRTLTILRPVVIHMDIKIVAEVVRFEQNEKNSTDDLEIYKTKMVEADYNSNNLRSLKALVVNPSRNEDR